MSSTKGASRRGGMMRNIMHLGFGQVATTILTVVLNAAVARALSPTDFGLMYLLISIATFAYVIVDWGYGPYIIREAARHPEKSGELLGSALALRAVVALLACIAAVATTWVLGYDPRTLVLTGLMIIGWLPQYLGLSYCWVFRSHGRMDRDAQLQVANKVAILVCSIACLALGGRLEGLVLAWSIAGCVTLGLAIAIHKKLQLPKITMARSTARALLWGGAPIFLMTLAVAVEPFFNANILYKMASPEVVGWYGAAAVISGTLIAPATVLGTAMYPRLSTSAGDPVEFKRAFDLSFRPLMLLAILGAVGTYLFAEVPVAIIYGLRHFAPAADTLRAFALVLLFMYVDIFLGMAILAAGKASRLAGVKVASVLLTTALVFALVPICQARFANGGLGVMYGMAIGELLMFVAAVMLAREAIDGRTIGDIFRSLIAGAATVLLFRLMPAMTPFIAIPLCVLVFAGLSFLTGAARRSDFDGLLATVRK